MSCLVATRCLHIGLISSICFIGWRLCVCDFRIRKWHHAICREKCSRDNELDGPQSAMVDGVYFSINSAFYITSLVLHVKSTKKCTCSFSGCCAHAMFCSTHALVSYDNLPMTGTPVTWYVVSVKCYPGGKIIPLIPSIYEILSLMCYHCVQ